MPDLHQRQLIRDAVKGQLANRTSAGARVGSTRLTPYNPKRNELPAISIYTMSEQSDRDSLNGAPRELTRELTVEIAGAAVCDVNADDPAAPLDALAKEIEAVIDADPYLSGTVGDRGALLASTDVAFPDLKADPVVGIITITYSATYYTSPAPGNLDDLLRTGVTTQIGGAGADNTVSDLFNQETP